MDPNDVNLTPLAGSASVGQTRSKAQPLPSLASDEISELKTKMQAVLFSITDGIIMTDFDGNILLINDRAKRMLGIQKRFPYEKKFLDYIPWRNVREELRALLQSSEENAAAEFTVSENSKILHMAATKNIVTTARGEILGLVVALKDETSEKEVEKMKEDFVHSITHDLKSPLTSIQGYLDLFLTGEIGELSDEQRRHIGVMDHSAKKLMKLINNLLDMAKFEAGQMTLKKTDWEAVGSIYRVIESLQGITKQNKVRVSESVVLGQDEGKAPLRVFPPSSTSGRENLPKIILRADAELLDRAMGNLIDNALKFTPENGEVEVRIEDLSNRVEISVRDTGHGIPSDALEKIFQKFKQAPGTQGGTGLGLAITKNVIEAHGGQISVSSELKKGTTFTLWLPKST